MAAQASRKTSGRHCTAVLVSAQLDGRPCLALLATPESVEHRANLAGEPRDRLRFEAAPVASEQRAVLDSKEVLDDLVFEGALFRAMQITCAMQHVLNITNDNDKNRQ